MLAVLDVSRMPGVRTIVIAMNQSTDLRRRVAELEAREEQFKQAEASLARLATYPEQNPNPVIETDLDGVVTYRNPAAIAHFPDLSTAGIAHPLLADMA
ncbi:MAG: hypothetical protein HN712_00400, partial [Gemmatimonadetes bacterium]|nr:hypothetical protein [Gemmatimonadota bacterium]